MQIEPITEQQGGLCIHGVPCARRHPPFFGHLSQLHPDELQSRFFALEVATGATGYVTPMQDCRPRCRPSGLSHSTLQITALNRPAAGNWVWRANQQFTPQKKRVYCLKKASKRCV